jgi:hypothetical protein
MQFRPISSVLAQFPLPGQPTAQDKALHYFKTEVKPNLRRRQKGGSWSDRGVQQSGAFVSFPDPQYLRDPTPDDWLFSEKQLLFLDLLELRHVHGFKLECPKCQTSCAITTKHWQQVRRGVGRGGFFFGIAPDIECEKSSKRAPGKNGCGK